jgi:P pilus assembly chaperone PapD
VFVQPAGPARPVLSWSLGRNDTGQTTLELDNRGNAHTQVLAVMLRNAEETIEGRNLPVYLLPGQHRTWRLDTDASAGTRWTLTAATDAGPVETELVLEAN